MSEAKRDHSAYHQKAVTGRAIGNVRTFRPGAEPVPAPNFADLRMLEFWEDKAIPGGDPYNGIGARAIAGRGLRK